jgi:hypothetical protein
MRKFFIPAFMAILALGSLGCASIVSLATEDGLEQKITFNSDPSGVKLFLNGTKPLGETPLARKIERSENQFVIAKKEGFEDQRILLTHHFNHWFWGNVIFGGLIGSTVDYADSAVVEIDPTTYYITMMPQKMSFEQRRQYVKTRGARNLLLVGYPYIQEDLARGEGEYLMSVLTMLKVRSGEKEQALNRLKKISVESKGAPEFAERVLIVFSGPKF